MYSVQEFCLRLFSSELHSVEFISTSLVSSIFSVHSSVELGSTNLFTNLFCTYKFYSLNAHYKITGFITFTLTTPRIPNKFFIAYAFINRFFAFTPASIIIPTLFIITNTMFESTFKFTCFMPFYGLCFISS